MNQTHLGRYLVATVVATLLIAGIIVFKDHKTIHYTYANSEEITKDIGIIINQEED